MSESLQQQLQRFAHRFVQVAQTDERIVATTVAITEFMDVLEIDLVGIPSSYKNLPERYADATEIGNPMWPDMEIVMSLQPTNVLSVTTLKEDLETDFDKINAPATFLNLESVSSMLEEIEKLGEQYDRVEKAEQFVNNYKEDRKSTRLNSSHVAIS